MIFLANFFLVIFLSSCSSPLVKVTKEHEKIEILNKIQNYNQNLTQLKALIDIRARGFLGNFIHEQADIVAQSSGNLLFSLRSFFDSPIILIASNQKFITLYDFTDKDVTYQKIPLSDSSFIDLFGFSFHPSLFINFFLAKTLIIGAHNLELKRRAQTIYLTGIGKENFTFGAWFDLEKNILEKMVIKNDELKILYEVKYEDYIVDNEGISFPLTYVVHIKNQDKHANLMIKVKNYLLNGEKISDSSFFLLPPNERE